MTSTKLLQTGRPTCLSTKKLDTRTHLLLLPLFLGSLELLADFILVLLDQVHKTGHVLVCLCQQVGQSPVLLLVNEATVAFFIFSLRKTKHPQKSHGNGRLVICLLRPNMCANAKC